MKGAAYSVWGSTVTLLLTAQGPSGAHPVQYRAVQYRTVKYSAKGSALQYSMGQYKTVHYRAIQYTAKGVTHEYSTVQYSRQEFNTGQ